ncbi:hypothetical protein [Lysobacter enzymogenes]
MLLSRIAAQHRKEKHRG